MTIFIDAPSILGKYIYVIFLHLYTKQPPVCRLGNRQPPALTTTATVTDLTRVSGSALEVLKQVRNVTTGGPWSVVNLASSGDVLEYRISYTNLGTSVISNLLITDHTPPYTRFVSAADDSPPAGLAGCVKNTPTNPLPNTATGCNAPDLAGGIGAIRWSFDGGLNPAASGSVRFSVLVQ